MSHGMVCFLDSFLRGQWYNQGQFPLSKALFVSAKQKKGLGLRPRRTINMSKIDEVMKAWQEDHQKVSWQDLQTLKAENEALRAQLSEKNIGQGAPDGLLESQIEPRPLLYPLSDYHRAMADGPLHYTWIDKPHRLVYDLIAAVRYYASDPPAPQQKPLTDEQINTIAAPWSWVNMNYSEEQKKFARAIESIATEPLLQRIVELERQLEDVRKLALEEAAVECDKRAHAGDAGALMAARAIRALKGEKE